MDLVQEEFLDRQEDLDSFVELVKSLEQAHTIAIFNEEGNKVDTIQLSSKIHDVFKSVILLMCYNQVESTFRGCLEHVYDHFEDNEILYSSLRESVQKEILTGILKTYESGKSLHKKVKNELDSNVPKTSLNIRKVFNGNISIEKISALKSAYGLNIQADPKDFDNLRNTRNDLAHGNYSFSKIGRKESLHDCVQISDRVTSFLDVTIDCFEDYISNEKYLAKLP